MGSISHGLGKTGELCVLPYASGGKKGCKSKYKKFSTISVAFFYKLFHENVNSMDEYIILSIYARCNSTAIRFFYGNNRRSMALRMYIEN